jgi:hypothetical protein
MLQDGPHGSYRQQMLSLPHSVYTNTLMFYGTGQSNKETYGFLV